MAGVGRGCGPSAAAQAALAGRPASLQAGGTLVLYTPPNVSCAGTYAEQEDALAVGGKALQTRPGAETPLAVTVVESAVEGSNVILKVSQGAAPSQSPQRFLFYRVPSGAHSQCLRTDPSAFQQPLHGKASQPAFTPWAPGCAEIHAVGEGA